MKKILIIGANSAIAQATAKILAKENADFYLLARNKDKLEKFAAYLKDNGAKSVEDHKLNTNDFNRLEPIIDLAFKKMQYFDIILIAHGTLPKQRLCEKDLNLMRLEQMNNAISTTSLLTIITNKLGRNHNTVLATITSIADNWINRNNYIYASAKGMVSIFLKGLRVKFQKSKITILEIKPGLVKTPMTAHLKKKWAVSAEFVAKKIVIAINKKKEIVYIPYLWKWVLFILNKIPKSLLNKLNL